MDFSDLATDQMMTHSSEETTRTATETGSGEGDHGSVWLARQSLPPAFTAPAGPEDLEDCACITSPRRLR